MADVQSFLDEYIEAISLSPEYKAFGVAFGSRGPYDVSVQSPVCVLAFRFTLTPILALRDPHDPKFQKAIHYPQRSLVDLRFKLCTGDHKLS